MTDNEQLIADLEILAGYYGNDFEGNETKEHKILTAAISAIERSRWVDEIEEPHQCPHCKSMIGAEWLVSVNENGREFYSCSICDYEPLEPYAPREAA